MTRAWRIQLATWAAGSRLPFAAAVELNLVGEAAGQLTPNRLAGDPARFLGMTWAGVRPVAALVAVGVEAAAEWPVFGIAAIALAVYYVPDWGEAASQWLQRNPVRDLVTLGVVVLAVVVAIYLILRLLRSGRIRHRVRRQWLVAWTHVRRAPWWVLVTGTLLTVVSLAARALVLAALAWGMPGAPPLAQMFFGSFALQHAPLLVPLPSGGGGVEVAFLSGFAGEFGPHQVTMLFFWRFYSSILLIGLGLYFLVRTQGATVAKELLTIGWFRRRT